VEESHGMGDSRKDVEARRIFCLFFFLKMGGG
jgi:hypothetical protein